MSSKPGRNKNRKRKLTGRKSKSNDRSKSKEQEKNTLDIGKGKYQFNKMPAINGINSLMKGALFHMGIARKDVITVRGLCKQTG